LGQEKEMPLGGIIALLILLPNLLVVIYPPVGAPPQQSRGGRLERWMGILERAGQVSSFAIPFFYALDFDANDGEIGIGLAVMLLSLAFYYVCWVRYLALGHRFELLFKPCLGFMLPLAMCPVVYFLAAAVVLHSPFLWLAALALGVGHIYVSFGELKRVREYTPIE
jgi:hypothetical protein